MPELRSVRYISRQAKAAQRVTPRHEVYLGWCNSPGKEVPRDKSEAVKWYHKAALSGCLRAQVALGWRCFSGEAGKKDHAESAIWRNPNIRTAKCKVDWYIPFNRPVLRHCFSEP